ncbi:hypothetical protein [Falsigemmobacter faecalis]|uniref:hypothetical protein n=1 Tax=Falsigemmobacter faecalis TaxID=2488730 RepID=UPI0013153125|nr:hypothetical protein [Falsigemmobacter faecalis]
MTFARHSFQTDCDDNKVYPMADKRRAEFDAKAMCRKHHAIFRAVYCTRHGGWHVREVIR